jgi:hypothetical protein
MFPHRTPGPPSPRQCGRCRSMFPGDTSLDPSATPGWWACAPCRLVLFPRQPRKYNRISA